jgi:multicomponent K+:H+ antiporter subunit E
LADHPAVSPGAAAVKRWFPHPIVSFFVLVVWLGLHSSLAPLHLVSGGALAVLMPMLLNRALDDPVRIHRPGVALRLAAVVLWDIIVANVAVARRVLGRTRQRPGFIEVPVDLAQPDAVALLASIIAITPGTVVAGIDDARTRVLVHVLDLDDPGRLVAEIKHRYERPLKEIFGC